MPDISGFYISENRKIQNMHFNNERLRWDELRLFIYVARAGGLSGATSTTDVSSPTLSRKMTHLEGALGFRLFKRLQTGYDLTEEGRQLLAYALQMEEQYKLIEAWRERGDPRPVVKITAGSWTSIFITQNLQSLGGEGLMPRIHLLSDANFLNFSRREADIGIRNQRPEQQGLARQRIGSVTFAIYGGKAYVDENFDSMNENRFNACNWIALSGSGATGKSSDWLNKHIGGSAQLVCSTPHSVLEAAAHGAGLCVLPCFIGSTDPRLTQCSKPIEELTHTQWLVTHDEGRKIPHIKQATRDLFNLFTQNQSLFG